MFKQIISLDQMRDPNASLGMFSNWLIVRVTIENLHFDAFNFFSDFQRLKYSTNLDAKGTKRSVIKRKIQKGTKQ